jgi:hypothetical protein
MPKCTCAFAGIEFRMSGRLNSACLRRQEHKPLGRQMAAEHIVSPLLPILVSNTVGFSENKGWNITP